MSLTFGNPIKKMCLDRAVAELAALVDDAAAVVFKDTGLGARPVQAVENNKKPAAYVQPMNERPTKSNIEEIEFNDQPFLVQIVADTDMEKLEAAVRKHFASSTLNGNVQHVRWFGTDTPVDVTGTPLGCTLPAFRFQYATLRTDPTVS